MRGTILLHSRCSYYVLINAKRRRHCPHNEEWQVPFRHVDIITTYLSKVANNGILVDETVPLTGIKRDVCFGGRVDKLAVNKITESSFFPKNLAFRIIFVEAEIKRPVDSVPINLIGVIAKKIGCLTVRMLGSRVRYFRPVLLGDSGRN